MSVQELLSVKKLAELYRVAPHTVRYWIESGELKALNVRDAGKRPCWRIDPDDVEAFRQARSTKTKTKRKRRNSMPVDDEVFV